MNGIEVCRKLLKDKSLSGIKIVLVSGYLHKYQEDINKLKIASTLDKPFRLKDLENKLMPLLNQN